MTSCWRFLFPSTETVTIQEYTTISRSRHSAGGTKRITLKGKRRVCSNLRIQHDGHHPIVVDCEFCQKSTGGFNPLRCVNGCPTPYCSDKCRELDTVRHQRQRRCEATHFVREFGRLANDAEQIDVLINVVRDAGPPLLLALTVDETIELFRAGVYSGSFDLVTTLLENGLDIGGLMWFERCSLMLHVADELVKTTFQDTDKIRSLEQYLTAIEKVVVHHGGLPRHAPYIVPEQFLNREQSVTDLLLNIFEPTEVVLMIMSFDTESLLACKMHLRRQQKVQFLEQIQRQENEDDDEIERDL